MKYLVTRRTFSCWVLSWDLSILYFLNDGLEWQPRGWKLIILSISGYSQYIWINCRNNSQGLFLKGKYSFYGIKILSANHIGIINLWAKDCIVNCSECVNIDKIPDLKKESICSIQFYCNINNMMYPVQMFINSNVKIFNSTSGLESFSTNFILNFTVCLFSLVFKN